MLSILSLSEVHGPELTSVLQTDKKSVKHVYSSSVNTGNLNYDHEAK